MLRRNKSLIDANFLQHRLKVCVEYFKIGQEKEIKGIKFKARDC